MLGALFNFHLNRRRDAFIRKQEAVSVAAALYREIVLLRNELARLAATVASIHMEGGHRYTSRKIDEEFVTTHGLPVPTLYPALAPKLGLLDANMIVAVTEFHRNYQEVHDSLSLLVEKETRGFSYSPLALLVPARDGVRKIVPTLRQIESLASIREPAKDPDLGDADDVIEMQEEMFNTPTE